MNLPRIWARVAASKRNNGVVPIGNTFWPLHGSNGQCDRNEIKRDTGQLSTTKRHSTQQMEDNLECNVGKDGWK